MVVAAQVGRVVNAVVGDVVSSSQDHDDTAGSSPVVLLMFGLVALLSFVSSLPPFRSSYQRWWRERWQEGWR